MGRNWIKIETVTCDKPEVCVVATQLKVDPDMVVGKLVRLWSWAEVNRINGNEMNVTYEFIDKVVGKKGFAAALAKAGWLKTVGDKLQFPNFGRHNGPSGKGRALTAQRVSRHRDRKRTEDSTETEKERNVEAEVPRREVPRTKPRNERRNTVKELIESALESDVTVPGEEILPADSSVIESHEAEQVTQIEAVEDGVGLSEETVSVEVAEQPDVYEDVTIPSNLDEAFDQAAVTDSSGGDEEDRASAEILFATEEDRAIAEFPLASEDAPPLEADLPEAESEESEAVGSPSQKGKKVRGGPGATRKVIVPETPDQPLLF
jgi:hypothetical protein